MKQETHLLRWFACLVLTGPIHIAEQLMFGLDTLYELRPMMAGYYSHFENPDIATVLLVIFVVTLVQSLLLAVFAGGRWRLFVAGLFGAAGVAECHHLIQSATHGGYFPGAVTSILYIASGVMILRAVRREWPTASARLQPQVAIA